MAGASNAATLVELLIQEVAQCAVSVRPSTALLVSSEHFGLASNGSHLLAELLQPGNFDVPAKGKKIKLRVTFSARVASSNLQAFEVEFSFASKFIAWDLRAMVCPTILADTLMHVLLGRHHLSNLDKIHKKGVASGFNIISLGSKGSRSNAHDFAQVALVLHAMLHQFNAQERDALQVHAHHSQPEPLLVHVNQQCLDILKVSSTSPKCPELMGPSEAPLDVGLIQLWKEFG